MLDDTSSNPKGIVGTNVSYGRAFELGFEGAVPVREFLRTQVKAWGKDITPKKVTVHAHTRKVKIPQRSFLVSALKDMQPEIVQELGQGVTEALKP
jgi:phage gpG-like protein